MQEDPSSSGAHGDDENMPEVAEEIEESLPPTMCEMGIQTVWSVTTKVDASTQYEVMVFDKQCQFQLMCVKLPLLTTPTLNTTVLHQ